MPDLVMVTGDLAEDGSMKAYEYLSEMLGFITAPLITVPGNHDNFKRQKSVFPQTPIDRPLLVELGNWQIIALNSAVKNQISGTLSQTMLDGLDQLLQEPLKPKLVALHHQPVATGSGWIDRYALCEPQKMWDRFEGRSDIRAVAWGHIHHELTARRGSVRLMGTPSTAANSLSHQEKFSFDPAGPACRLIELGPAGEINTRLIRA